MKARSSVRKAPQQSFKAFREARVGMFIHWGLYSILGRHEWVMCYEHIPPEEYRKLMRRFNPRALKMKDWVRFAKQAGMRYMCLTTRHHDGFALFDSNASDYNSMHTPARRDFVREYVDACRKGGMLVGLYYSVGDWSDLGWTAGPVKNPKKWERYVGVVHTQLRELMSNYGKIDYLFYDGCPPPETWACAEINAEIRRLQPKILISSRCGLQEDVDSTEVYTLGKDPGRAWECCMTSDTSWGYNYGDGVWQNPRSLLQMLFTTVFAGGNFLLNVGPRGDGSIPAANRKLFQEVGAWLKKNGEAIFGADPNPFGPHTSKGATCRGHTAFIALHYYHGPNTVVAGIANKVKAVRILATGKRISFRQEDDRIFLTGLPRKEPDPVYTVVAFDLDGKPKPAPSPWRVPDDVKYRRSRIRRKKSVQGK